jgi:EAL domain-containing protein (putative c-di-GMP-specific phosphodiesterase class I)
VEKLEQLAFLKRQHCEEGQGYFLCRAIAPEQFTHLLATASCNKPKYKGANSANGRYRLIQY